MKLLQQTIDGDEVNIAEPVDRVALLTEPRPAEVPPVESSVRKGYSKYEPLLARCAEEPDQFFHVGSAPERSQANGLVQYLRRAAENVGFHVIATATRGSDAEGWDMYVQVERNGG